MIKLLKLRPYTGDIVAPSPNHGVRKSPTIKGIVLHATADEGDEGLALSWMRSPKSHVSCHLVVSRTGRVSRLVGDQQRAWHAGGSHWRGTTDVNSITLGIEIANRNDGEPFTDAQYGRVAAIVAHYCRQGLSLNDVVSHCAIAAGRKTDPYGWDWERFRSIVRHQLRAAGQGGGRLLTYDRRGVDRVAAEQAVAASSTGLTLPSITPPPLPDLTAVIVTPVSVPDAKAAIIPSAAVPNAKAKLGPPAAMPNGRTLSVVPPAPRRIAAPPKPRALAAPAPKPALRSRTLWLNGAAVLASGGMLIGETLDLAHRVGITPPEVLTKWALFIVGIVNIVLRLRTTRPVTCSQGAERSAAEPTMRLAGPAAGDDIEGAAAG